MLYGHLSAQEPRRFDVVIHEIFPDPSPAIGLPASEFIELRNISGVAYNLRNWKISDGSATATIAVNYILKPDSLVVICPSAAVVAYAVYGATIGVAGFPSLNNDGDVISVHSPGNNIIHSIAYEPGWYNNAVKSEGGWALEMMDARNACGKENNWKASIDASGGTPGRNNSVQAINPDLGPPALLQTYTVDSVTVVAVFDEAVDSSTATTAKNYELQKGPLVVNAAPIPPGFKQVYLTMGGALLPGMIYDLHVAGITDCAGNNIGIMNSARSGLPSDADVGDLLINEILFNPTATGSDYVEVYNKSDKILDASTLFLCNRNAVGVLSAPVKLSETPFLVFPADFIVVTANTAAVKNQYSAVRPLALLSLAQFPSLPDDKGSIVLLNHAGTIIDELAYDEKWHFPLLVNREGVSLERIDYGLATQDKDNWTSAAADAGYGTPTGRNSQFKTHRYLQGKVEADAPVFSPDGDGHNDLCFLHYQFPEPNNVAAVTVFDVNGMEIRRLYKNTSLSEKGVFRWDGLDDRGMPAAAGVYIILTQVFSMDGRHKNFKNAVTLARSF
ncbi:MAG TPA: lamin tail domain-containing protein [Chitinophagaceae bacterium]|nr:lamin tail domain-containing protein [Chitinophagaceae bacterium]